MPPRGFYAPEFARTTKIIATLGPASASYNQILSLYRAGANFFRLNFSHGSRGDHENLYNIIHRVREDHHADIGVLGDLSGPKHRIGVFEHGEISLQPDQNFRFDLDETPGDETRVCMQSPEVIASLTEGQRIFLDDGNVEMVVTGKGEGFVLARVVSGEKLSDKKGFNVPDLDVAIPALTDKDREDIEFAVGDLGVDWLALSFVQNGRDVEEALRLIDGRALLMSKIEKPQALRNLDEILRLSDGVMVARGDLGVEFPFEQVPVAQRHIVDSARRAGKPAVVATQMMESMIHNPRPTRAEVGDVSGAVAQGVSAVMLSAETASGHHSVAAVETMALICKSREDFIRNPESYVRHSFGNAHGANGEAYGDLPPPVSMVTWQERRLRGEPNILSHLKNQAPQCCAV